MQQLRALDDRPRICELLDLLPPILARNHELEIVAIALAPYLVLNARVLLPEEPKHFTPYRSQSA